MCGILVSTCALNAKIAARNQTGSPAPRPGPDDQGHRPSGQRQPGKQEEVVGERRRRAGPEQRDGHHALRNQRLGIGDRPAIRIEDVPVEQVQRIARRLVRDPRHDPFVQHRVAVVVARPVSRIDDHRPGVYRRHDDEKCERREPRMTRDGRPVAPGDRDRQQQRHGKEELPGQFGGARGEDSRRSRSRRAERPRRNGRERAGIASPLPVDGQRPAFLRVFEEHGVRSAFELDVRSRGGRLVTAAVVDEPPPVHRQHRAIV